MAKIKWAFRAVNSLHEIVAYIALDDQAAAKQLEEKVFSHCDQLERNPRSGPVVPEMPGSEYRQLIEPPGRIFYRIDGDIIYIVNIVRSERLFRLSMLDVIE